LLSTAKFSKAACVLSRDGKPLLRKELNLAPIEPAVVALADAGDKPVDVAVTTSRGQVLARFTTPLPIPKVEPPDPAKFREKPDDQSSVEELYLKGRKFDRETDRLRARAHYEKALARDAGHAASLRALAVLDYEAALYDRALARLVKALARDGDDGLAWFVLGECHLRLGAPAEASRCGFRAARCSGAVSIGYDLVGRARSRLGDKAGAISAFRAAVRADGDNTVAVDRLILAHYAAGKVEAAATLVRQRIAQDATAILPRAVDALRNDAALAGFARELRSRVGDRDFETLEVSLAMVDAGLPEDARRLAQAVCVDGLEPGDVRCLPLYHLAWYASLCGDTAGARQWLAQAAATRTPRTFASRWEELEILRFAVRGNPADAQAHLQLGCLLANFGRMDEAAAAWQKAVEVDAKQAIAWRNLGLVAATKNDLAGAEASYRKAIAARPDDQTLYRDLAEILVAAKRRPDAIQLIQSMPAPSGRRAEIVVLLAESYLAENRFDDCVRLWESLPYFVAWEGQDATWRLFNRAHIERGKKRLEAGDAAGALVDFDAALTYPANLNVGRSNKPEEAPAQYWRGKTLAALRRTADAQAAWQTGAAGADVAGAQNEYRQKCREALAAAKPAPKPAASPAPKPASK
jgi:tetratricopeptide (TPR) repeat protein